MENFRPRGLFLMLIAAAMVWAGCGRKEVAARAQPTTVTNWKYQPPTPVGIPKGLVIEQQGDRISAQFCDLKEGSGFTIDSTLAHGKYVPERSAIIFPLGMPDSTTVEQWLQAGGPHLAVPYQPRASQLIGSLAASGSHQSFEFARHRE